MSRYKKEDWLALGARLLAEEGPAALTIERLTAAAKRTRGSFYHHFEDRDTFVRAMMERWREQIVEDAAKRFEENPSPEAWRRLMRESPFEIDFRFEREIRRLAASEPIVREILGDADRARIEGSACVIARLRPDIEDPKSFAFVLHCALVGGQWLLEGPKDPRIPAILKTAHRLFGIAEPEAE